MKKTTVKKTPALEGAEADAAGLFCSDFHVAQDIGGDDHQAALVVLQPQLAALGDRVADYLGDGVGALRSCHRGRSDDCGTLWLARRRPDCPELRQYIGARHRSAEAVARLQHGLQLG